MSRKIMLLSVLIVLGLIISLNFLLGSSGKKIKETDNTEDIITEHNSTEDGTITDGTTKDGVTKDGVTKDETTKDETEENITTQWELKPSFKYDVLCFLNTLVGDEYYLRFYQKEYDRLYPTFTPEVTSALEELSLIRSEKKVIIGAYLSNVFSKTDDETLEDMIETLSGDYTAILGEVEETEEIKQQREIIEGDLITVFRFLQDNNFKGYWEENILPLIEKRIREVKNIGISQYDILPEIEKYTGIDLQSDTITIYFLNFAQPHGIKIEGTNYITDISYDFKTVVSNAIHEMIHSPFQADNSEFIAARAKLEKDEFITKMMYSQDQTHGYTSYESYFEENCVDALEVLIRAKFNCMQGDAGTYLKTHDGGADGLAIAIYSLIKQDDFSSRGVTFQEFIIDEINNGELASGKVEDTYNEFMNEVE